MTLTINLTPAEEARLTAAARQKGLEPAEFAHYLIDEHLPPAWEDEAAEDPTIALLQSWIEDDTIDDPAEIEAAQRELDEFKQEINIERDRAGARRIYP